jgi:hypothetical protein
MPTVLQTGGNSPRRGIDVIDVRISQFWKLPREPSARLRTMTTPGNAQLPWGNYSVTVATDRPRDRGAHTLCDGANALLLAGLAEQVFDQRGDNKDDNNPDGNLHGSVTES